MLKRTLLIAAAISGALFASSAANATLMISALVNGTSSFSCFDNQAGCDTNAAIGTLTLAPTTIGGVQFEGSSQFQIIGPPTNDLLTNSQQITNTTGSTATIVFVAGGTDFAAPTTAFTAAGSGTWLNASGSFINLAWYGDTANQQGAEDTTDLPGVQLASAGPFNAPAGAGSFDSGQIPGAFVANAPYSWTILASGSLVSGASATLAGRSQDITADVTAVPEPSTLLIYGVGLIGAGGAFEWFKRRRKNADYGDNFLAA